MGKGLIPNITDDKTRTKTQYICVFLIIGTVSVIMTLLNLFTNRGILTMATATFALLCFLNLAIVLLVKKDIAMQFASISFMAEIIVLFTFFIISGNPDGFSAIWVSLLPCCGMLLFGIKRSAILCGILLAILIFFFWIPAGTQLLQYEYNSTFMARFPVLFVAFFSISALLEVVRMLTQKELDKLKEKYKYLSEHDQLTELLNRQGLMSINCKKVNKNQTLFMFDIDHFKNINDTYGHIAGDLVLSTVAKAVTNDAPNAKICRWGGDEFIVWFPTGGGDAEAIRQHMEKLSIRIPKTDNMIHITISVGVAKGENSLNELITFADKALYKAKANGRNRIEYQ